jgi:tetratricopeptide (TPR) repeat protein
LFALSLLCKSVGVTLPVVLFLIDYYEGRKLSVALVVEKLPHFALSFLFGWLSISAQKGVGALGTLDVHFSIIERFALGCYGLCMYVWKLFVPTGLTNFYPYPMKINDALPMAFYVYPAIVLAALGALWFFARKNRLLLFGLAFFVVNLLLLLQFIPVGGAIMSDRYTYLPYMGLFLIVGWYVSGYFTGTEKKPMANAVLGITLAYCAVFCYVSNLRTKDWYDSVTLWKDNIEKHPESPIGYFYLGQEYYTRFEAALTQPEKKAYGDSAFSEFSQSVMRKPDYASPIICIGEYQRSIGQYDSAKKNYFKAIAISDKNESAFLGLGVIYCIKGQYDSSQYAFKKALSLKAYFPEGHSNYANFFDFIGKPDSALKEYEIAIRQNPDAVIPYMNRASILFRANRPADAIKDYERAMLLKPENPEPYYLRAQCYAKLGKKTEALRDVDKAKAMGYAKIDPKFYQSLK